MTTQPEPITHPDLRDLPHGFFTRKGGVSTGLYESLNAGPGSADTPKAVAENRERVARALGADALVSLAQVHSARAVHVTAPFVGSRPEADAMVTTTPGLALGALSADCAPVLFADRTAGVVAAAHAGWRGAIGGVLEATVEGMQALGATPSRITAVIGPTISQRAYEVGPEFVERFLDDDPENARFFAGGRSHPEGDRAQFDLPSYALARLRSAGIGAASWTGHCTHSDPSCFFSHRRGRQAGEGDYGRLVAAIALPAIDLPARA
ncbi:MAG: peptidoglycan editing factor PgeF [Pseudomonadota bacterium]